MNNPNSSFPPSRDLATSQAHRRQTWIQILLPMIVGAIVILVLAVLVALGTNPDVTRWMSISVIFLILPTVLIGLIVLALFGLGIYLTALLLRKTPLYTRLVQIYIDRLNEAIKNISDKAAQPIVRVDSAVAGVRVLFSRGNHR